MREKSTIPRKPKKPISVAIDAVSWPAWMPRPASQPALEAPMLGATDTGQFDSELPTVAEVQRRAAEQSLSKPKNSGGQSEASKAERVQLVRTIGRRMREAREELAGLSQTEASRLLGYSRVTQFCPFKVRTK